MLYCCYVEGGTTIPGMPRVMCKMCWWEVSMRQDFWSQFITITFVDGHKINFFPLSGLLCASNESFMIDHLCYFLLWSFTLLLLLFNLHNLWTGNHFLLMIIANTTSLGVHSTPNNHHPPLTTCTPPPNHTNITHNQTNITHNHPHYTP